MIKPMHGNIIQNKSLSDCGKFFFVLNPCRSFIYEGREYTQVVVQNLDDKMDVRYVDIVHFESGHWYIYNNKEN